MTTLNKINKVNNQNCLMNKLLKIKDNKTEKDKIEWIPIFKISTDTTKSEDPHWVIGHFGMVINNASQILLLKQGTLKMRSFVSAIINSTEVIQLCNYGFLNINMNECNVTDIGNKYSVNITCTFPVYNMNNDDKDDYIYFMVLPIE